MTTKLDSFSVMGIAVRTNKKGDDFAQHISDLWNTFMTENILNKIPNKINDTVYAVYTDYESDYTEGYTMILGCQVESTENIPEKMVFTTIEEGNYTQFTANGDITKGVIYDEWKKIWKSDIKRRYTTDFEVYGTKTQNPQDAEVAIFIATI